MTWNTEEFAALSPVYDDLGLTFAPEPEEPEEETCSHCGLSAHHVGALLSIVVGRYENGADEALICEACSG